MAMTSTHAVTATKTHTILNLMGKPVKIFDQAGNVVADLPSNGEVRASSEFREQEKPIGLVPLCGIVIGSYEIPQEEEGLWILVPPEVMYFYFLRDDLVSPGEPVYDSNGALLGYSGLVRRLEKFSTRGKDLRTLFDIVNELSVTSPMSKEVQDALNRLRGWYNSAK